MPPASAVPGSLSVTVDFLALFDHSQSSRSGMIFAETLFRSTIFFLYMVSMFLNVGAFPVPYLSVIFFPKALLVVPKIPLSCKTYASFSAQGFSRRLVWK